MPFWIFKTKLQVARDYTRSRLERKYILKERRHYNCSLCDEYVFGVYEEIKSHAGEVFAGTLLRHACLRCKSISVHSNMDNSIHVDDFIKPDEEEMVPVDLGRPYR